jgi:uncharacterized RDD family membrane protein YckC
MEPEYPTLLKRAQSIFIDSILMVLLMFVAGWLFDKYSGDNNENDALFRAIAFVGIWAVYEPLSQTLGCTLGNYLMKIRVRKNLDENKRVNIFQAYARFVIRVLLGWFSFITIGFNEKRRAIHDLVSGTVMVEK